MEFIGHFSTQEDDAQGNFTMIVSAKDPEEAVEKFKQEILRAKKEQDMFEQVERIFLDDIIQINKVPKKASILRYESRPEGSVGGIWITR